MGGRERREGEGEIEIYGEVRRVGGRGRRKKERKGRKDSGRDRKTKERDWT